jgi:hypothetical protein
LAENFPFRSREEIEELKASWVKDDIWDLEETSGFERYKEELKQFSDEMKAKWAEEKAERDSKYEKLPIHVHECSTASHLESVLCEEYQKGRVLAFPVIERMPYEGTYPKLLAVVHPVYPVYTAQPKEKTC